MNLQHLAWRNMKQNRVKYGMYFFALTFCIFTSYTFFALLFNDAVVEAFLRNERFAVLLGSTSIIIIVFVLFFLIHSNHSFMKARKKEISTYVLFGMTEKKIATLLFYETMIVGIPGLMIGIVIGIFFSKLVTYLIFSLSLPLYSSSPAALIELEAIILTVLFYIAIYVVIIIANYLSIRNEELVDLFKAEKVAEERWEGSIYVLVFSILITAVGYGLALLPNSDTVVNLMILIVLFVIQGTFFFFWSGVAKVIYLIKRWKKKYYQAPNLIAVSSASHQMKSMSSLLATIAILTTLATTAMATAYTLYQQIEINTYNSVGYDLLYFDKDEEVKREIVETLNQYGQRVTEELSYELYEASVALAHFYGDVHVFPLTTYNQIVDNSKSSAVPIELKKGEVLFVDALSYQFIKKEEINEKIQIEDFHFTVKETAVFSFMSGGVDRAIVVQDEQFQDMYEQEVLSLVGHVQAMNYTDALRSEDSYKEVASLLTAKNVEFRTTFKEYHDAINLFGLICFIGLFISAIVIVMTASLLYFKQILVAEEEKHQYKMLRKIGLNDKMERKVLTKRIIPIYLIPLGVGLIHSLFAMKAADTIIFSAMIPQENSYFVVLASSSVMYAMYILVYGMFYFITKVHYTKIIRGEG
ncbi:ABC transporter permease [Alkalihalobacillus sp. LMS39]|uniref:ABC transporter permease n=1 Tax=Alkalihalobacillus sp. LMS39 TaxID=2924032 RepID=UPI001FB27D83|nr:ABC transporter permease [Alkalihalobacillus sp. LMS39]UOE94676.1 ABC transporter permease [Alkalihalobacillus sp. LMS39]